MIATLGILKAIPAESELVNYVNALLTTNNYVYAISTQKVPALNNPPKRYSEFINLFLKAQNNPCKWTQAYFGIMVSTPYSIVNHANPFADLEVDLKKLIVNPHDQQAMSVLKRDFVNLQTVFTAEANSIEPSYKFLKEFQSSITSDANSLKKLSDAALKEANADKVAINQLNVKIFDLQNEIAKNKHIISEIELIGKGVDILLEIATGGLSKIESKLVEIIFNLSNFGTDESILGKLVTEQIQQLQDEIIGLYSSISDYNKDIAVLGTLSTQFVQLSNSSSENNLALSRILSMWQNLATAVGKVVSQLETQEWKDLQAQDYQQALTDLETMKKIWSDLYTSAKLLTNVTYNWQDTQNKWFQFGLMNPRIDEIKINDIRKAKNACKLGIKEGVPSRMNKCKPVKSDDKNWFTTGDVVFDAPDWELGQTFYVPIVRLTDDTIEAGFSKYKGCVASMAEKFIGASLPNQISTKLEVGQQFIESIKVLNVNEFSDLSLENIKLGNIDVCNCHETHNCSFENSLILQVKTKTVSLNSKYTIRVGISNNGMNAMIEIHG